MLNLPIYEPLLSCKNLLIAGMGGGFDLFCGLPIYFALRQQGQTVHLANLSFAELAYAKGGERLSSTLVGVTAEVRSFLPYFPEYHLARWFKETRSEDVPVWCFAKTGGQEIVANYRTLVERLSIDGILLIDGGVDSLMRGDEALTGTPVEDSLSLLAASQLPQIPVRLLGCIGLGAEQDIAYAHVFENMAALAASGHFLGACSLTRQMEEYRAYELAVLYVHEKTPLDPSVINASIISAVRGHYDNYHLIEKTKGSRLWISPLMPLYWFFDLPAVAERSLLLEHLVATNTFQEALQTVFFTRQRLKVRSPRRIGLS